MAHTTRPTSNRRLFAHSTKSQYMALRAAQRMDGQGGAQRPPKPPLHGKEDAAQHLAHAALRTDRGSSFLLWGKPLTIISGAVHYFRVPEEYWEDRLRKLRYLGANTVETCTERGALSAPWPTPCCGTHAPRLTPWLVSCTPPHNTFRPATQTCRGTSMKSGPGSTTLTWACATSAAFCTWRKRWAKRRAAVARPGALLRQANALRSLLLDAPRPLRARPANSLPPCLPLLTPSPSHAKVGLYVLLRPSPYICAEWDYGGMSALELLAGEESPQARLFFFFPPDLGPLPALAAFSHTHTSRLVPQIRSLDSSFTGPARNYYDAVLPVLEPFQISQGGPVIGFYVENEFGGWARGGQRLALLCPCRFPFRSLAPASPCPPLH